MKKSGHLFLAFFLLIGIGVLIAIPHVSKPSIAKVLESDAYSYLSKEAKKYVEEVYENSGEIVLTEKNKQENVPYLNPKYVAYLDSTLEEQQEMEIIPTAFVIDYSIDIDEDGASLPSTYDLRNVNGKNFVTPIKNQQSLDLCWDFTSVEQMESYLLVENNTSYSSSSTIFSTRQLDYASSKNGIKDYTNDVGTRELTSGGNFLTSSIVTSNGLGLISENTMPFSLTTDTKELADVLNYSRSMYELNSSVLMPALSTSSTSAEISTFVKTVKQLVIDNGGAYVGTQGPGYSCSSDNNGSQLIRVDGNHACNDNAGHAMQIIGWDDNYSYSYCLTNKKHTSDVSDCSGTVVSGTGAWLLRNSWGTSNYPYVYLAYNSLEDDIYVFTSLSSMSNRNWDNNYHKDLDSFHIYYGTTDTQSFTKNISTPEKIQKIKGRKRDLVDSVVSIDRNITKSLTMDDIKEIFSVD